MYPPARARPSGAFWVSVLVLVYPEEGFQVRGQVWTGSSAGGLGWTESLMDTEKDLALYYIVHKF